MAPIGKLKEYKKTLLLMAVVAIVSCLLLRALIKRPADLICEYRRLETEYEAKPKKRESEYRMEVDDSLRIDVSVMKMIMDEGCVMVQGKQSQVAVEDGMELVQYEFACSGTYSDLMRVWKALTESLPDTSRITYMRIGYERDKDRKGWSLISRVTIQTIRMT